MTNRELHRRTATTRDLHCACNYSNCKRKQIQCKTKSLLMADLSKINTNKSKIVQEKKERLKK